jgi:hypothetical protein
MKKFKPVVLSLAFLVCISSVIQLGVAELTITRWDLEHTVKDYNFPYPEPPTELFRYKVLLIIQTESDGKWDTDAYYRIDYIITLTSINESFQNEGYTIAFEEPGIPIGTESRIIKGSTNVSAEYPGTLTVETRAPSDSGRYTISGSCKIRLYRNSESTWIDNWQYAGESIGIDVVPAPNYVPIILVGVGVAVTTVSVLGYFGYRFRKKKTVKAESISKPQS